MPSVVDRGIHQGVRYETTEIDHGMNFIERETKKLASKDAYTAIGYFAGKSFDPSKDIAARAVVHEYGAHIRVTRKMWFYWLYNFGVALKKKVIIIPKRPFMRMTFEKNAKNIEKMKATQYNILLSGKQTAKQALERIGVWYVGRVQDMIKKGDFVPNSPLTMKLKRGSAKPLIDTGQLRNSVVSKVFGV